jgi:hypothetical protein
MAPRKPPADIKVETFGDHQVISQPNPLRKMVRYAEENEADDPVARAEKALAALSGEFHDWMQVECDRLSAAYAAIARDGLNGENREELFAQRTTSKAELQRSAFRPPPLRPKACAGSSNTRRISRRCRATSSCIMSMRSRRSIVNNRASMRSEWRTN